MHSSNGFQRSASFLAFLGLCVVMGRVPANADTPHDDIPTISNRIAEYKQSLFQHPGGIRIRNAVTAAKDPFDSFAFEGALNVDIAVLWPKLFVSGTGEFRNGAPPAKRESVYDFLEHSTTGYGDGSGFIIPQRHMFSSGYCHLFKYMHFAEAFQKYRYGEDNSGLSSVPECFHVPEYEIKGEEVLDGVKCLLIEAAGFDRVWLAVEKGYLVHKRESHFTRGGLLREATKVEYYLELAPGKFFPRRIAVEQFCGPDELPERRGKHKLTLIVDVSSVELGKVDPSLFEITFPAGIRITDVGNDRTWYNNRPIDEVVNGPTSSWWLLAFNAVLCVVVIIAVIAWHRSIRISKS